MGLYAKTTARGIRVQADKHSKSHMIIMPDACIDAVLEGLVAAGFGSAGQWCMSLSTVIFVVESKAALDLSLTRGILWFEKGNFIGPTILDDVTIGMECYKEEIVGPVLLCMQARKLEEAIAIVNRNKYLPTRLPFLFLLPPDILRHTFSATRMTDPSNFRVKSLAAIDWAAYDQAADSSLHCVSVLLIAYDQVFGLSSAALLFKGLLTYGRRISFAELFARIDAVDSSTVKRVANRFIHDRDIAIAATGPIQSLPDYNWFRRRTYWNRY
ncbi:hypothetical protein Dimus_033327 [Dionaea muscipula]